MNFWQSDLRIQVLVHSLFKNKLISFCSLISVWLKFAMLTTYQKPSGILLWFWNMLDEYNCLIHVVKIASFINLIYRNLPAMLKTIKTPMEYSTRLLELNNCPLIYNGLMHYDFILLMLSKSFLSLIYSIEIYLPCWKPSKTEWNTLHAS